MEGLLSHEQEDSILCFFHKMICHFNVNTIQILREFFGKPDKLVPKLHRKGQGIPNETGGRTCLNTFYKTTEMQMFGIGLRIHNKPMEQRTCETKPKHIEKFI